MAKSGDDVSKDNLYESYHANSQNWATYVELGLGSIYFGFLLWALAQAYWIVVPFLTIFAFGFYYTGLSSFRQSRKQTKKIEQPLTSSQEAPSQALTESPDQLPDHLIVAE